MQFEFAHLRLGRSSDQVIRKARGKAKLAKLASKSPCMPLVLRINVAPGNFPETVRCSVECSVQCSVWVQVEFRSFILCLLSLVNRPDLTKLDMFFNQVH